MTFDEVLQDMENRGLATGERRKGTDFEKLCKRYLEVSRTYGMNYKWVKLWSELELEAKNAQDIGIDLVAFDNDGKYVAIQCKFYARDSVVSKSQIDKFISASTTRMMIDGELVEFDRLILIHTARELGPNVQKVLENHIKPITVISRSDFEEDDSVNWGDFSINKLETLVARNRKKLRPHQEDAVGNVIKKLETADRTKLIMACGTGKTLCGVHIIDRELEAGEMGLILFPSLALVSQTFKETCSQSASPFIPLITCSDSSIGKNKKKGSRKDVDEDSENSMEDYQLPISPTTNPVAVAAFIHHIREEEVKNGVPANERARIIIFSTYQSIDIVIEAQRILNDMEFKIILCDEAHRTAGYTEKHRLEEESYYVKVHNNEPRNVVELQELAYDPELVEDNGTKESAQKNEELIKRDNEIHDEILVNKHFAAHIHNGKVEDGAGFACPEHFDRTYIKGKKRVYMTATPRIFASDSAKEAKNEGVTIYSMSDEKVFGETAYELNFGDALNLDLLTEYKVVITVVNSETYAVLANTFGYVMDESQMDEETVRKRRKELGPEEIARLFATWKCLCKEEVYVGQTFERDGSESSGMKTTNVSIKEEDPGVMKTAIAFNSSIARSVDRKFIMNKLLKELNKYRKEKENDTDLVPLSCDHVDGSMNQNIKIDKLKWLSEANNPELDEIRVLSNARCLTEGIDVPSLDAVVFFDTKSSMVDIVQAVGRVMRKSEGKKYGYIILPVVLKEYELEQYEDFMQNKEFAPIWKILKALRSHDESLVSEVEYRKKISVQLFKVQDDFINGIDWERFQKERQEAKRAQADLVEVPEVTASTINIVEAMKEKIKNETVDFKKISDGLYKYFFGLVPDKLGDKEYWSTFVKDIAKIVETLRIRIRNIISTDKNVAQQFNDLTEILRNTLNETITLDDSIDMMCQHVITLPIFDTIFGRSWIEKAVNLDTRPDKYKGDNEIDRGGFDNPIATRLTYIYQSIEAARIQDETNSLTQFYEAVHKRANYAKSDKEKQEIVRRLYDAFFQNAFAKDAEKLGIVYTPVQIVDFIIHSVDKIMQKHFGKKLSDKNVKIMDPFTGTGTFIVRMIQEGLLDENLEYKFEHDVYAHELLLLAYYIANINISTAYQQRREGLELVDQEEALKYVQCPNMIWTDTFDIPRKKDIDSNVFGIQTFITNSSSINREINEEFDVIIGNPPYSAGQKNQNDNNKNNEYPYLYDRIRNTFVGYSNAKLLKSAYDSYKLAMRWALDRIKSKGIVAFVTNISFIKDKSGDGVRKTLAKECSDIYIIDLRGHARSSGVFRKKEGGSVFGGDSRTHNGIIFLVKDPDTKNDCARIKYYDIGDYLSTNKKLETLESIVDSSNCEFAVINQDEFGDWFGKRDTNIYKFIPLVSQDYKLNDYGKSIYNFYTLGIATSRDRWVYNYSYAETVKNAQNMIDFYNDELTEFKLTKSSKITRKELEKSLNYDLTKIKWTNNLIDSFEKGYKLDKENFKIFKSQYRPFCKKYLYYYVPLLERKYKVNQAFPKVDSYNLYIQIIKKGSKNRFTSIMSNSIPNYDCIGGQAIPYCYYNDKDESFKVNDFFGLEQYESDLLTFNNLRDFGLNEFKNYYPNENISCEDIFYYVYGVLNSDAYIEKFDASLKNVLPRIPFFKEFRVYLEVGRKLGQLHTNYEDCPYSTDVSIIYKNKHAEQELNSAMIELIPPEHCRVEKMRQTKDDMSTIIFNDYITIKNIPDKAYNYFVNSKTPIHWVMTMYRVTVDKDSGIKDDPNLFSDDPRYILKLLLSVIELSVRTVDLIDSLPKELNYIDNHPDYSYLKD